MQRDGLLRQMDWLNSKLTVERRIVRQIVDDVKTDNSRKTFDLADELLQGRFTAFDVCPA